MKIKIFQSFQHYDSDKDEFLTKSECINACLGLKHLVLLWKDIDHVKLTNIVDKWWSSQHTEEQKWSLEQFYAMIFAHILHMPVQYCVEYEFDINTIIFITDTKA